MSFADKARKAMEQAKDKAAGLADQHGDKVGRAVDKAGDVVDRKTKGKYAGQVGKAQSAAKGATGKLAASRREPGDPATPDHPVRP